MNERNANVSITNNEEVEEAEEAEEAEEVEEVEEAEEAEEAEEVEEVEEAEEVEEVEEDEEVFIVEIEDLGSFYTNNDTNGNLYEITEDDDVGKQVGVFKDGEVELFE